MLPKPIFHNESAHSQNSISSEDEVFMRDTPSLPTNVKLQRRNAIRRNKNASEPRVTRQKLLNLNTKETRSQPTTPRRINLQHCQNLEEHLRPRHPITNEVVNLDQVQNLHNVLPSMTRRSLRKLPRIDYARLHRGQELDDAEEQEERQRNESGRQKKRKSRNLEGAEEKERTR